MSKILLGATFALLVCVSLAAQAPASQAQPQSQTPAPTAAQPASGADSLQAPPDAASQSRPKTAATADMITVEGCIQRSVQAASATAGATGTAGTTMAGGPFILANAMKPMGSSGATGTSGSSAAAATIASTYRLDAADSMLSPHVGHKVEITGTLEDRGDSAPSTSSATSSVPSAPKLKVDNVKMIAAACTP